MSGIFGSGTNKPVNSSNPKISSLRITTSTLGRAIATFWGKTRIAPNLIWFGKITAVPHNDTSNAGGKGGGPGNNPQTTFTYTADLICSICHGVVTNVPRAWVGKVLYTGETIPEQTFTASEYTNFSGATYTVRNAALWTADVSVFVSFIPTDSNIGFQVKRLVLGVDYTVSAGVYSLISTQYVLSSAQITYQYTQPFTILDALAEVNMTLIPGSLDQAVWPYLTTNYPDQALAYPAEALAVTEAFDLGDSGEVPNINVEVENAFCFSADIRDAHPSDIVNDVLMNPLYGVFYPPDGLGDLTNWAQYCTAIGFFMSPALTEQAPAQDFINRIAQLTNSEAFFSEGKLKIATYADEAITGHGVTFTPNLTPLYSLTDDDFLPGDSGMGPIKINRTSPQDRYNVLDLKYYNRDNEYNEDPLEVEDIVNVTKYGKRVAPQQLECYEYVNTDTVRTLGQIKLQRYLYVDENYQFMLPFSFCDIECMDLLEITETFWGLEEQLVRVIEIEEDDAGLKITAEIVPSGIATAVLYPSQSSGVGAGAGGANFGATPNSIEPPVFFEAPPERAGTTGLAVWAAATAQSGDTVWGGCNVWVSFDGTSFQKIGQITGGSRYGVLTAPLASGSLATLSLLLAGKGGTLNSGTLADAMNKATLCYVDYGTHGEYLSYQTANLTGTNAYDLTGLVRGQYNSPDQAAASGSNFIRVDNSILQGPALTLDHIGQTIYFKFTSFNTFGHGEEALADVPIYSYVVRGNVISIGPPPPDFFTVEREPDGTRNYNAGYNVTPTPVNLAGFRIKYKSGTSGTWDVDMTNLITGLVTQMPFESNLLTAGTYTIEARAVDTAGNESASGVQIITDLGDPRLGDAVFVDDFVQDGWPGTKTDCEVIENGWLEATDTTTTWATAPSTWNTFLTWKPNANSPIVYEHTVIDLGAPVAFTPEIQVDALGTVLIEERHSDDNITYTSYTTAGPGVTCRYIQFRVTVTATITDTVPTVKQLIIIGNGKLKDENINDVNPAALTGSFRIGTGDIRLPITGTYTRIVQVQITIQNATTNIAALVLDKDVTVGPHVQFRNASNTLVDPPLIDAYVKGY